jgi:hypothetical protein
MIDTFAVWTPFEVGLAKSSPNGGDAEPLTARIGGIISMESKDQQGETLLQDGIDWSYFLEKGWFNYEHRPGPDNVMGHPESVTSVQRNGKSATRVEGVLYLAKAKAREIYETAQAMQKAGTSRRLGFSVEGQVVQRDGMDPKRIKKARVLNVALTAHPVHPDARLEVLVRSLTASGVGYQTPAAPSADPGATLSSLVPQSIEPVGSLASYAAQAFRRRKMTLEELALLLTTTFPHVNYATAMSIAVEIQRAVR